MSAMVVCFKGSSSAAQQSHRAITVLRSEKDVKSVLGRWYGAMSDEVLCG